LTDGWTTPRKLVEACCGCCGCFHRHNGHGPTVNEIAYAVGRSRTAVRFQLDKLIEDGIITHTPGKIRTIRVVE